MEKITDIQVICENCGWQGIIGACTPNDEGKINCAQCDSEIDVKAVNVPHISGVRYPAISVRLLGENGNAFFILGTVCKALKRAQVRPEEITKFTQEATSGDYDKLLGTCMRWVNVE